MDMTHYIERVFDCAVSRGAAQSRLPYRLDDWCPAREKVKFAFGGIRNKPSINLSRGALMSYRRRERDSAT